MQENINAFLRVLDAKDNSTGGGTASSVAGAMAAGLAAMVARLSMGKKDLAPTRAYQTFAAEAVPPPVELSFASRTPTNALMFSCMRPLVF